MSTINTNVQSLLAQRILGQQNKALRQSLERLSTGLQINRGSDNPAGLIASEALRSEKASISAAIGNAERADQVINIAEGGLQEINSLLIEVQSLVGQSANEAGMSEDERRANQLQIDSILQTIDRIAGTTSFQGSKLLNGTLDFTISAQTSQVVDFQINAAKRAADSNRNVQLTVTASAQHAGLFLSTAGATILLDDSPDSRLVLEVGGTLGSREFTIASATTTADVAAQINEFSDALGVTVTASGGGLAFKSTSFGSDAFVAIDVVDDGGSAGGIARLASDDENAAIATGFTTLTAAANSEAIRDSGQNVGAIINGVAATSRGRTARINTDFLDVEITLNTSGAQSLGTLDAFTITGGGAVFNLGPNVDISNQVSIGVRNVATRNLGNIANGFLDQLASGRSNNVFDGDLNTAQKIVNDSINQLSGLRGRLGAFQKNTIGATIRSLGVALENTSAAESAIRDTDFATETAELTRAQILVNAATQVLGIANAQPQSVLALLG
jgi:flagellin